MKTLGVDSTAGTASVALTEDGKILAAYSLNSGNTHSTTLLPMIESLLSVLRMTVSDVDLFALSAGPGSFTGVRIGAATIKGLAFANNTPCIGVSSLESAAWNLREYNGIVIPSINARRNTVFFSAFECCGGKAPKRLTEDNTVTLAEACDFVKKCGKPVFAVGDGAALIEKELGDGILSPVPEIIKAPNAVGVCLLAEARFAAAADEEKKALTHGNLDPVYLKKPQAEREREERMKAENNIN